MIEPTEYRRLKADGTPNILTQAEVEAMMYYGGIKRADGMMAKAEEAGRAVDNPYAGEILNEYVLPLAAALKTELDTKRVGRRQAHATLLEYLDPEAVALLAVRSVVNNLLGSSKGRDTHRTLAYDIGKTVHNELVLMQIEESLPELYHTLAKDFGRRMSKDERHRMTVFKMQAAKAGLLVNEWPVGARDQVGMYLLGLLEASGLVEIEAAYMARGHKMPARRVALAPDLLERIDSVKAYVAITMPVYGPCVAAPRDWSTPTDGGYHTRELKRAHQTLVRGRAKGIGWNGRGLYDTADLSTVYKAVNALQRTAWQVNERVLDIALEVAKHFTVGEITSLADSPKPAPPSWLTDADTKEARATWPEEKQTEFKKWKRAMAEWYTQKKLKGTAYGRFYSATRSADMFRLYPAIYFVYFADTRGRLYPMTYGLNPQGSDLQRGLIRFSKGMALSTPEAIRWFHVQGANKYGFDKATLKDRHQWVVDRQDMILAFAADPINNNGWKDADNPLQFLAWCLEYADWVNDQTGTFVSHLPISMDGSCNGLQNLSALLRDEVGGKATNLTANAVMEDIYRRVAEATTARLLAMAYPDDPLKESLRLRWLNAGVTRSVMKRSVMTTPYGVTKRSAMDYVIEDTLKKGEYPCFETAEYMKAANVLMEAGWPAIGDIVVKGREAMEWLKKAARIIIKQADVDDPVINWTSPSGFPATQAYWEVEEHRISTRLAGFSKIKVLTEKDEADPDRHSNGLAPNFVHSMDAAHLHLTTAACASRGIDAVAMIHDDYGTHAANAQAMFEIIREQFVAMYEHHDPVADFSKAYPFLPAAPEKGCLDIREVLRSDYFFS